jgi:PKD repeat protein
VLALTGDASKITLKNLSDLNKLILKKVVGSQGYQVSINRIPALLNGEYIFSIDWQALSQGEKSVTVQIDEDGDGEFEKTIITDATLEFPTANAGEFYENAEGAKIIFDASLSTDLDGSIILYEWDFDGDGNYDESSTLPTIAYTYGDDYNGEVILRVTDDEGLTDITTNSVIINNVVPILSDIKIEGLFHPEQEIWAGDGLNFFGNFTDPGWLDSHTAIWDFGDETTLTGLVVEENSPPAATGQVTGSHIYYDKGIYTVTFIVKDDDGGVGTKTLIVEVKPIPAVIDFVPDTLNLASKGKFITAYIELPEGYDVTKINVFSIMLNNLISVLSEPTEIGDYDNDGIPDLMVKFDRSKIQAILTPEEEVTLTLVGELVHDDIDFKGFDTIRVINPGEGKK